MSSLFSDPLSMMMLNSESTTTNFSNSPPRHQSGMMTRSRSLLKLAEASLASLQSNTSGTLEHIQPVENTASMSTAVVQNSPIKSEDENGAMSSWKVLSMDRDFVGDDCSFQVTIRSKGEEETSVLPDNLYSSIKYHIGHKITGSFIRQHNVDGLRVRLQVVDPETLLEVLQNNRPIVKGVVECVCVDPQLQEENKKKKRQQQRLRKRARGSGSRADELPLSVEDQDELLEQARKLPSDKTEIGTSMKIQLTSCSYHHARAKFAIMATYYRSNRDDNRPVMVLISTPFLCFARKPTANQNVTSPSAAAAAAAGKKTKKKNTTGVKRKRTSSNDVSSVIIDESDGCPDTVQVDRKVVEYYKEMEATKARYARQAEAQFPNYSDKFKSFVANLEELFDNFPDTTEAERSEASSLVVRKMLQLADGDNQTQFDQPPTGDFARSMHMQLESHLDAVPATTPSSTASPPSPLPTTAYPSFPSSASYSSLLALTEQQFSSPFDITQQLASDDDVQHSSGMKYSLSGSGGF